MKLTTAASCFLAVTALGRAQIPIVNSGANGGQVNLGSTYTQAFDSLANSGSSSVPWVNNSTLPGWYAHLQSAGVITQYNPSTGPASGSLASFGLNGATDRALGTGLNLGTGDSLSFGAQFINDSSSLITGFTVSFDGEQWQKMSNSGGESDSLTFSYQIFAAGAGGLSVVSGWTTVDALTFVSPVNTPVGTESLNGNLAQNRVANINSSLTGIALAPGQELWIKWTATNLANINDHSLAIDNLAVSFSTIPEPAAYTVSFSLLALAVAGLRRRKRSPVGCSGRR